MKLCNCGSLDFLSRLGNKKIVCVGASKSASYYIGQYPIFFKRLQEQIIYFIDNSIDKQYTSFPVIDSNKEVLPFDVVEGEKEIVLLICTGFKFLHEIVEQLQNMRLSDEIECYYLHLLLVQGVDYDALYGITLDSLLFNEFKNEKIIHCCWLSGEEKPQKYKECMASWRRYCPDYRIVEWNADNYDISKNRYLKEAFDNKQWAFASDYIRLDVVYMYGGIYLDMDVELLENIDRFLKYKAFFCFDLVNNIDFGSGFGAIKNDALIKQLLEAYDDEIFVKKNGEFDRLPQPSRLIHILEKQGLLVKGVTQNINDRLFLSNRYFTVFSGTDKNEIQWKGSEVAIHWHKAGWFDNAQRQQRSNFYNNIGAVKELFSELQMYR